MGIKNWFTFEDVSNRKKEEIQKENIKKVDLDKELKTTGIILIIVGILHFVLSGFLDPTWGIVLIPVGFISFFYRSRRMLLVFGILLILVGALNLITSAENSMYNYGGSSSSSFWTIFAFFQIYWGIKEIIRFRSIKENPKYLIKKHKTKI